MMFRLISATIVMTMVLILSACVVKADESDPAVAVVVSYYEALNTRDVDTAIALFNDDATCDFQEGVFRGTGEIRGHLETIVERNYLYQANSFELVGDTVIWYTMERGGDFHSTYEVVVQDSKIKSMSRKN